MFELKSVWSELREAQGENERLGVILRALHSGRSEVDPSEIRSIVDLSEQIYSAEPALAALLVKRIASAEPPACQWMKAYLLEWMAKSEEAVSVLDVFTHFHSAESEALRLQALSRNYVSLRRWPEAATALRAASQITDSLRLLLANEKLLARIRAASSIGFKRKTRVAILGNVTFDYLAPLLRIYGFASGIDVEIYLGPYGQHQQEILGPSEALQTFGPSLIFLAVDWRSLGLQEVNPDPEDWLKASLQELRLLWRRCAEKLHAQVIQHNFEVPATSAYGRLSMVMPGGRARLIQRLNLELWDAASGETGVHILDVDHFASTYGKDRWDDRALWHTAKQYPSAKALPLLARHQLALMRAALGLSSKCLVLDLDGTLWGGVIGEDGMAGIRLGGSSEGEAFREFQSYLKSLRERGIVLAVCSKNNEADAKAVFSSHPETVLALDDFAVFVANWRPKDENIRQIAQTLNLGLDSIVFVDDNPVERAWIRRQLPEVEVPEMPVDPADLAKVLDRHLYFEALALTEEDRQRASFYQANLEREQFQASSGNLDAFLSGLQMNVELHPFDVNNLTRIVQLINKTNQFNLTTERTSEDRVRALIGNSNYYTQFMRVRDRFGDNGIVGVLIASSDSPELRIDTWLMSCRVLGRKLDEVMIGSLKKWAYTTGHKRLVGRYKPTAKNQQVADLYERLGFDIVESAAAGDRTYALSLGGLPPDLPGIVVKDFTQSLAVSSK